ncbi:MAG: Dimethylsulfide dehydrogenase subunit alpha [Steroidobacteraceae bacterium]|nr:Dimethylsulfide dehydrogenase subunit alpha [Steroidobacteraceae bacterium]
MAIEFTRRTFLTGAGGAVALSLGYLGWRVSQPNGTSAVPPASGTPGSPIPRIAYASYEDIWRAKWRWDSVAKSTHFVNCWYQRGCNWNVYVRDGIVWREEQSGTYEQIDAKIPDYNPRGCQKGACYSERMYDGARLRYPLKRVGERGEGKWQRVSWDEGLREVADRIIDVLTSDGPGAITWDPGTANTGGCNGIGTLRAAHLLDTPVIDVNADVGDHHPGAQATVGKISFSASMDDLFHSDLILIWGGNPIYTQIPNAHFITEARYNGARIVTIAPDYSASAIHADAWIPVNPGSDAALALSMAHVIVAENLHDTGFIREQTDLPLLVRLDTRKLLRASDLERGGRDDRFWIFDTATRRLQPANHKTLALGERLPALEGEYQVDTLQGRVSVTPAFALLRAQLAQNSPEKAAAITGVDPDVVRDLARRIAAARAATCLTQSNFSKYYHGLEMERCQILVLTLCGQIGRKGSGITGFPAMAASGIDAVSAAPGSLTPKLGAMLLEMKAMPRALQAKLAGLTDEMIAYELMRDFYRSGNLVSGNLFWHQVGLGDLYGSSARWDPSMKRELCAFLEDAFREGWQIQPSTTRQRIFLEVGGNILRRTRAYDRLQESFIAGLDLLVTLDWRMSNTALHSDYVFPAAGWYEKDDITWATPLAPYAHVVTRAVPPLAESKSDWAFNALLMKTVQQRARERGIRDFTDRAGKTRRLDEVFDQFSFGGRFDELGEEKMMQELMSMVDNLGGISWEEIRKKGYARYTGLGTQFLNLGNATDIKADETITANTWHTEKKQPWPTLTRRIQFYIDHPFFLEQGEQLPSHKDSPAIGGAYPLRMTCAHARWSIHASWRDDKYLLRLQRGEPEIQIGTRDAARRGIVDGDRVRVYNDIGSFKTLAKVVPGLRPGQVLVHHAWEPFQYEDGKSYATVTANPLNPLQLAGGYFHLQPLPNAGTPGPADRDTVVEVERMISA